MCWRKLYTVILILITAILALITLKNGLVFQANNSQVTSSDNDIRFALPMALAMFKQETGHYPTTSQGLRALIEEPAEGPGSGGTWKGPYLKKRELPRDPWGQPYNFVSPGIHNPDSFDLWSWGRDGKKSADDIGNWDAAHSSQIYQAENAAPTISGYGDRLDGQISRAFIQTRNLGTGLLILTILNAIINGAAAWMAAWLLWLP